MAEYIDRVPIIKKLEQRMLSPETTFINTVLIRLLEGETAADVVELKHGYWKLLTFKGGRRSGQAEAKCSICGRDAVYQITEEKWEFENYCPHCGAKMDGEHNGR